MPSFPPQTVVFDLDGVIIDSFASNVAYYSHIALGLGLAPLSPHDQAVVHRETHEQALLHIAGPARLQEAMALGSQYNAKQLQQNLSLFEGVEETLALLRPQAKLAIGTNRSHSALGLLRDLKILDYFDLVVTPIQAPEPKPHPAFMAYLLSQLNMDANQAIYVGDSSVDEILCLNSQVRLLAFQNPSLRAWAHVNDFRSIPGILGFA